MNLNPLVIPTLAGALLLFVIGEKSMRRCHSARSKAGLSISWLILGIPGFLMPLYYLHWFDNALWFYIFRSFPFTELTAASAGLFAGALAEQFKSARLLSRPFWIALLCLGIIAPHVKPVLAPIESNRFVDRWRDGVCLQSTPSSCGPASAATILASFGLKPREKELAKECFTYRGGTENWYIARALRRRGFSVTYRVEKGLPADLAPPAIAGIRMGGMGHFIAIIDKVEGKYIMGDPLVGRQEVPVDQITKEFDFTGFFMEIRKADNNT